MGREVRTRIEQLREKMAERGMDAYLIPTSDFHGSEYLFILLHLHLILRIRYYVELKQGKELKETLEQIQQEHIYLSAKGKEALAFWQE